MGREINVLSIDFDFFQLVDADTIMSCYPDGLDLPTKLTEIVWAGRYSSHGCNEKEKLLNVKVNEKLLDEVLEVVLNNTRYNTKFMVANSHKHIYQMMISEISHGLVDSMHIYNLDMHHDFVNSNSEIDCGNWLGYAVKNFDNCKATWIYNPVSPEMFDFSELKSLEKRKTLRCLKNKEFDLVYLCRSDAWTPPHLDNYFTELVYNMAEKLTRNKVEQGILQPRNINIFGG